MRDDGPRSGARTHSILRSGLTMPQVWTICAVGLPIAGALLAGLATIDLAYQVRAGNLMLDTHHLIRVDSFTYTVRGRPWVDQQWGGQILLALVYRAGGWNGLAGLRAAIVGLTFLLVYRACRDAGVGVPISSLLTLGSFLVAAPTLALRPQLFAVLLFALVVWLLVNRHRRPGAAWALPVVAALWANLHGSFFFVPALAALAWLEDRRSRSPRPDRMLAVAVLSFAAITLNPFGLRVWSYAWRISTDPLIRRFVTEWQRPTGSDLQSLIFFVSIATVGVIVWLRRRHLSWVGAATLALFAAAGLASERNIVWWALVAAPVMASALAAAGAHPRPPAEEPSRVNLALGALVVALGVALLPWWRADLPVVDSSPLLRGAPVRLTAELRQRLRAGERVFADQTWGSWLELADARNPVFVDSTIEIFPRSVWHQYTEIATGQRDWSALLHHWRVQAVMADRSRLRRLIPLLSRSPDWTLAYQDADGLLFVRPARPWVTR